MQIAGHTLKVARIPGHKVRRATANIARERLGARPSIRYVPVHEGAPQPERQLPQPTRAAIRPPSPGDINAADGEEPGESKKRFMHRSSVPLSNESRLSCGALKKDSFLNLRAPPASSACYAARNQPRRARSNALRSSKARNIPALRSG